jgi:hypothetical protein
MNWLRDLSRSQFGLVTTEQAHSHGITTTQLTVAAEEGRVWPVTDAVWAVADAGDKHDFEDWAATWLTVNTTTPVRDRQLNPDALITHESAAVIRDLGTVNTYELTLTMPQPPNHPISRTRFVKGLIGSNGEDWTLVDGLPVASPARIIRDLAADSIDGSHLGTVIDDCLTRELLTVNDIATIIGRHAHRWTGNHTTDPHDVIDLLTSGSTDPHQL